MKMARASLACVLALALCSAFLLGAAAEKEDYDYDSAEKEDPTTTRNPTPMVDEDAAQETPAAAAAAADGDADPTTEKEEEKEGGHEFDMFELMAKGALEPSSSEGEDLWPSQQELAANAAAPAMSTSSAEMSVDPDPKPAEEDEPVPSDSEGISASVLLTPEEKEAAEMMAAAKLEELDEKDAYKTPEELAPAEDAKDLNHLAISPEHVDSTKDDSAVEDAAAAAAAKDAAAAKAALDAKAAAPAPAPAATVDARLHVIRAACLDICKNMCTMGVPINPECQPGCTDRCGKERDFPVDREECRCVTVCSHMSAARALSDSFKARMEGLGGCYGMCTVDKAANDCAGLAAGLGGRAGGRGRSDTDKEPDPGADYDCMMDYDNPTDPNCKDKKAALSKAKQGDAKVNNMPRLGAAAAGGDHASSTLTPLALWPVGAALVAAAVVAGAYVNAVCARPADFGADHPNYGGI